MKKTLFISLTGLLLSGCAGTYIDKNTVPNWTDESVIVFGAPANYHFLMSSGSLEDGQFIRNWVVAKNTVAAFSQNGFTLNKIKAPDTLALTVASAWSGRGQEIFTPCGSQKAPAFHVPAGKVLYFTHFDFRISGKRLVTDYSQHFEQAKAYVESAYPHLKGRLEQGQFELVPINRACEYNQ
ncbi:hypothetical protein [Chitinimonas lacunae]|uniref:Lipoprotein n=1 Tax=Chitinimonas lacunae TaxID=1963018 RepID=A0ABV8MP25_9NEIS